MQLRQLSQLLQIHPFLAGTRVSTFTNLLQRELNMLPLHLSGFAQTLHIFPDTRDLLVRGGDFRRNGVSLVFFLLDALVKKRNFLSQVLNLGLHLQPLLFGHK